AWFHKKITVTPAPSDLPSFMNAVKDFARGPYAAAQSQYPKVDPKILQTLSDMLGMPPVVLSYWKLNPTASEGAVYLTSLLQEEGLAIGAYDGRVVASDVGIAGSIDPNSGNNDPTMTAIGGVYTAMWNVYLNEELRFTAVSPFLDSNDEAFLNWNFGHIDPT